jgi:hypothetical protein
MKRTSAFVMALVAAGLAASPPVPAQDKPVRVYEAQWRERSGLLTCMKGETMHKSMCVKPCQPGFRMELDTRPPKCVATRPDAKYVPPPPPQYQAPEKALAKGAAGN